MEAEPTKVIKIFYCYAPQDQVFLDGLETHFKPLKRQGQIDTWGEHEIPPGAHRDDEIEHHLREADIVLLLLSPNFLASDHCQEIQQRAMELCEANASVSVIPIILRPILWEHGPLENIQPLPRNEVPISTWTNQDEAFVHVVGEIVVIIHEKAADTHLKQPQRQSEVKNGFLFIGLYPTVGYRWDEALRPTPGLVTQEHIPDAPWLVSQAVGVRELSRRYSIFEEEHVLRDFAKLSPTAEAIQQFANTHGYLTESDLVPLYYPEGKPDNTLWVGESLQTWLNEIREMNMLVSLWDMIKNKQKEALRDHIVWKLESMSVLFIWQNPNIQSLIASDKLSPELIYQWNWGEVIRPALYYLCSQINLRLKGHVDPTLFPILKSETRVSLTEMYMVPDSLLAALYVLLSMEVCEQQIEAE